MSLQEQITLERLFELFQDKIFTELNVCLPGKIESYDPVKQIADIKPLIKKKLTDGSALPLPVLKNVPVQMMSANGGKASITLPFAKGDKGMLVFGDRSMDEYLSGSGQEVLPRDVRKHHFSDAFFIPGVNPEQDPISGVPSADLRMKNDQMAVTLFPSGKISIQGGSIELITLLIDLVDALTSPTYLVSPAGTPVHTHVVTQPVLDVLLGQLRAQLVLLQGATV